MTDEQELVGSTIGSFRVVRLLGRGSTGDVYEGRDATTGHQVAIKAVRAEIAEEPAFVKRFFKEARTVSQLRNPNIVEIIDVGMTAQGVVYAVMELLEGESLASLLHGVQRLRVPRALRILRQIASALAAAHAAGVVHRDLTTTNVFLVGRGESEQAKVLDFGLARMQRDSEMTQVGSVAGNAHYLSPEQCRGATKLDERTDVYALGVILYEMVTGMRPFEGDDAESIMLKHISDPPPKPSEIFHDFPSWLEGPILRALRKDRTKRFASMAEFARALNVELTAAPIDVSEEPELVFSAVREQSIKTVIASVVTPLPPEPAPAVIEVAMEATKAYNLLPDGTKADPYPSPTPEGAKAADTLPPPPAPTKRRRELPDAPPPKPKNALADGPPPPKKKAPAQRPLMATAKPESKGTARFWIGGLVVLVLAGAGVMVLRSRGLIGSSRADTRAGVVEPSSTGKTAEPGAMADSGASATAAIDGRPDAMASAGADATPEPPSEAPPPSGDAPESATLRLRITPSNVDVKLDGATLASPYEVTLPRSPVPRKLSITSPGYATLTQDLLFDRDREVKLALKRDPSGSSEEASEPPVAAPGLRKVTRGQPPRTVRRPPVVRKPRKASVPGKRPGRSVDEYYPP